MTASLYDMTASRNGTKQVHISAENGERLNEIKRRLSATPPSPASIPWSA